MLTVKTGNFPSNIEAGWRQQYFHNERDGLLNHFINIFVKNGNNWAMKKDLFDQKIDPNLKGWRFFDALYYEVLDVDNETNSIHLSQHVVDHLLRHNWKFSFKSVLKATGRGIKEIVSDAWAFWFDPEARIDSGLKYQNGAPMSLCCAKKDGLIK